MSDLAARAMAARAALERARPSVDETLAAQTLRARALLAGMDDETLERALAAGLPGFEYETVGRQWEAQYACPDCPCFRTATGRRCNACGSERRAIPAHERPTASVASRNRRDRRRSERKRRK